MNENEFELSGIKYSAIDATRGYDLLISCDGCDLARFDCSMVIRPKCNRNDRIDMRDVIFVEVQDERAKG